MFLPTLPLLLLAVVAAAPPPFPNSDFQNLPPITWTSDRDSPFSLTTAHGVIHILSSSATTRDRDGLTLIPPSMLEFATTFATDLDALHPLARGKKWTVKTVASLPARGIVLRTTGLTHTHTHEDGKPTSEGYTLRVSAQRVHIAGAGARGVWWGTRTLLQQLALSGRNAVPAGHVSDSPAVATRGFLLDAGRKWYSGPFLKELCSYASFWKLNEFQYHLQDNYPLNRGNNATWTKVYSQFSLWASQNMQLHGLVTDQKQTLNRTEFADVQKHCASRGVTLVPELEAPGHALAITKWKPQLALKKRDLLNLTHPETLPTIKAIWTEFLPWFATREVHIGADEYDATLADDYIRFVNAMSDFIRHTSRGQKRIRIWGTNEPSTTLSVSKDITIQHWQRGESDPAQLSQQGYTLINSQDTWGYISIKNDHMPILPLRYPQYFNLTPTLNFAGTGHQWSPRWFNPYNTTDEYQVPSTSAQLQGAISASWNDNGPDASTQLEAFYGIRHGLPAVGARTWTGERGPRLIPSTLLSSTDVLRASSPGHDLERNPSLKTYTWRKSANKNLCGGSKGMNHTLTLTYTGPFILSGPDTTLTLHSTGSLEYAADGYAYPLRAIDARDGYDSGHPGRIWANATSSSHEAVRLRPRGTVVVRTDEIGGSRVWMRVGGVERFLGRFEVFVYGGRNTRFSWSQMAFVAPLTGVEGKLEALEVREGV